MHTLLWPALNLAVLIAIFYKYLRQPVRDSIRERHLGLRDELKRVRDLLRRAQEKHDEFSAKLKSIDAETAALREQARQDAQTSKLRVLSEAQRASAGIVADSRATAEQLTHDLKSQLFTETGTRILERAEGLIRDRLTGDDRARIREEFSMQVERAQ